VQYHVILEKDKFSKGEVIRTDTECLLGAKPLIYIKIRITNHSPHLFVCLNWLRGQRIFSVKARQSIF
jgi:hypothetical protein